jgi:putative redox protein
MASITTYYKGDMRFEAVMGEHRLVIDAPASIGGTGRGPTPPELFVTSLGSCVAAFVARYCEQVGLGRPT